jgi:hypothetical protein
MSDETTMHSSLSWHAQLAHHFRPSFILEISSSSMHTSLPIFPQNSFIKFSSLKKKEEEIENRKHFWQLEFVYKLFSIIFFVFF